MADPSPPEFNPYELSARITSLEEKLLAAIEIINNNQQKMGEDVGKIKEAVYNPDVGLYARLRIVEEDKKSTSKIIWFLMTLILGSIGAYAANLALG